MYDPGKRKTTKGERVISRGGQTSAASQSITAACNEYNIRLSEYTTCVEGLALYMIHLIQLLMQLQCFHFLVQKIWTEIHMLAAYIYISNECLICGQAHHQKVADMSCSLNLFHYSIIHIL
uniref:Uncharacterized protein n=1 Tax=Arion vulgaris TaxID=1028688 RepID=A0A0B7BGY0_9EUPU